MKNLKQIRKELSRLDTQFDFTCGALNDLRGDRAGYDVMIRVQCLQWTLWDLQADLQELCEQCITCHAPLVPPAYGYCEACDERHARWDDHASDRRDTENDVTESEE